MENILEQIKQLATAKNLSAKEISLHCNLSRSVVWNILSGRTICTLDQAQELASALNHSLNFTPKKESYIHIYDNGEECWCVDRIFKDWIVPIECVSHESILRTSLAEVFVKSFAPYLFSGADVKIEVYGSTILFQLIKK